MRVSDKPNTGGRPARTEHGTITALHPDGRSIGWSDGAWGGHPALVAAAQDLVARAEVLALPWGAGYIVASASDPLAVLAVVTDVTVSGPDAVVSGDVPEDLLAALARLASGDPDVDINAALSAVRGV